MIRRFTSYNATTNAFEVDGELVTSKYVGFFEITVKVQYDLSYWPLAKQLGVKKFKNSFTLFIDEGPEVEETKIIDLPAWQPP